MRLIDADALNLYEPLKIYFSDVYRAAQDTIDEAPTIDAVKVCRCESCKCWDRDRALAEKIQFKGYCEKIKGYSDRDDYCAWPERNDDELVE